MSVTITMAIASIPFLLFLGAGVADDVVGNGGSTGVMPVGCLLMAFVTGELEGRTSEGVADVYCDALVDMENWGVGGAITLGEGAPNDNEDEGEGGVKRSIGTEADEDGAIEIGPLWLETIADDDVDDVLRASKMACVIDKKLGKRSAGSLARLRRNVSVRAGGI